MAQNIYANFNAEKSRADRNGEQTGRKCRKKAEQIAMEGNIYENMAASQSPNHKMKPRDVATHRQPRSQKKGGAVAARVLYGLIAVCVLLLCLLLAAVAVLSVMFSNLTASNNQLQASYANLSRERDSLTAETAQLQTSYGQLIVERDQLQNSNNQLTAQRNQLQNSNNQLTAQQNQLQNSNNQLTAQRNQLQNSNDQLTAQLHQLQATCGMSIHLGQLEAKNVDQLRAIDSNLTMERDHLLMMYWNMTTESDQLKPSDDTMTSETEQSPGECSSLAGELGRLRTAYSNLTLRNDLLREETDLLRRGLAQLGWKYFNSSLYHLTAERKSWNESRRDCGDRSSDLVIVNSQEEWEFLCKNYPNSSAWIGLSDTEGQWEWVDGRPLSVGLWQVSGPRNDTSVEQCARTQPETRAWAYGRCDGTAFGLCEIVVGSM